jgi:hypothetical protein
MTQYQQILAAVKALGGKGTPKEIYAEIRKTNPEWGTKTPIASVSMYLSRNGVFVNENGTWALQDTKDQDDISAVNKKSSGRPTERGLYFITLSPYIKILGAGVLFKIGKSGDVRNRLKDYSRCLPFDTIQLISFYPIPEEVNLIEAEKQVNGELLGNDSLEIHPYLISHQEEWLQTLNITLSDADSLSKLASTIDNIVKVTIEALTLKLEDEEVTN